MRGFEFVHSRHFLVLFKDQKLHLAKNLNAVRLRLGRQRDVGYRWRDALMLCEYTARRLCIENSVISLG